MSENLPDDCYELQTLRKFRDEYLSKISKGKKAIQEYYKIAPAIVGNIDKLPNKVEIFSDMYERLVLGSIRHIEKGKNKEAFRNYKAITLELKKKYYRKEKISILNKFKEKIKKTINELEIEI